MAVEIIRKILNSRLAREVNYNGMFSQKHTCALPVCNCLRLENGDNCCHGDKAQREWYQRQLAFTHSMNFQSINCKHVGKQQSNFSTLARNKQSSGTSTGTADSSRNSFGQFYHPPRLINKFQNLHRCPRHFWSSRSTTWGPLVQPFRTYVKHIDPEDSEGVNEVNIKQFLSDNDIHFESGYTSLITVCPKHRRKIKPGCQENLYINIKTGYFVCHSCKRSGSWPALQDNINLILIQLKDKKKPRKHIKCFEEKEDDMKAHVAKLEEIWRSRISFSALLPEECETLIEDLSIQKLHPNSLRKYEVHMTLGFDTVLLPFYNVDSSLIGIKKLTTERSEKRNKLKTSLKTYPRSDLPCLFGWNTITTAMKEVVLTANEFDAIAVNQETKLPALALPKGDSILPQEVLPLLEQFKKIILWFGNDIRSWEMAKQFSRKLGEKRCYLIRPSERHPNALQALNEELPFSPILRGGHPVVHDSITTFSKMREELFSHLSQTERMTGIKWKRFTPLNNLLKGFRRGELTVFTGPTGSGKTTFISDYSLDLCMQGVNTLWGSFEIRNIHLLKTIMCQFSQVNLVKHLDQFEEWADRFEELSMYFMNFHGQESINKVIETMSHAVYIHDIAHVIVDNLQFMMGVDTMGHSDRFLKQDAVVSAFRRFATQMNCHVTLVIHPRKERDSDDLTLASVFGSAKATQEADNVIILQDKRLFQLRGRKYLQIAKNRFDGELGVMPLKFNKETFSFALQEKKITKKKHHSNDLHEILNSDLQLEEQGHHEIHPDSHQAEEQDFHSDDLDSQI